MGGDMFDSIREELETTVAPLLRDIVEDARKLVQQETELVRVEVREEVELMRQAMFYLVAASTLLVVALLMSAFMFVYLVSTDWFQIPIWQGFGIIAVVAGIVGVVFSVVAGRKLKRIRESSIRSAQALREGTEWMRRVM